MHSHPSPSLRVTTKAGEAFLVNSSHEVPLVEAALGGKRHRTRTLPTTTNVRTPIHLAPTLHPADLHADSLPLRQMAAALLYNLSFVLGGKPSDDDGGAGDATVQALCGLIEELEDESDAATAERRLLAVGRFARRLGSAATNLLGALGCVTNKCKSASH